MTERMREAVPSRSTRRVLATAAALAGLSVVVAVLASGAMGAFAPRTSVSTIEAGETTVTIEWKTVADADGYAVYRSAKLLLRTQSTRVTFTNLKCGRGYTVAVRPFDWAHRIHFVTTIAYVATKACKDSVAPTKPTGLKIDRRSATAISLRWRPSKDNVKVTTYRVTVTSSGVAKSRKAAATAAKPHAVVRSSRRTQLVITGLACATTYTVSVEGSDAAGNRSRGARLTTSTMPCAAGAAPKPPAGVDPTTPPAGGTPTDPGTGGGGGTPAPAPTPDSTPPSVPSGLHTTTVAATGTTVAWSASTDNVAVTGYTVYRNGASIGTTTTASYFVGGLTCGTSYSFTVDAYDASGNHSPKSTALSVSTSPCTAGADATAPSVPAGLHTTSVTTTSVGLAWSASTDNVGVAGYTTYRGGVSIGTGAGATFAGTGLVCGTSYAFAIDAYDTAGNHSGRTATLNVATSACPDTAAPSVPTGLHPTSVTTTSITLAWTASTDDVGVTGYTKYRGNVNIGTSAGTSSSATGLACGTTYSFAVDAYDAAGHHSAHSATLNVATSPCADSAAPSVPGGLHTTALTTTSIALAWNASTDNVGVTGYTTYRNGAAAGTGTGASYTVNGLACGTSYAFAVDAYDAAGNHSAHSATVNASTGACSSSPPPPPPTGPAGLYLSPSGSDSGSCTQAAPCRSFDRAFHLASGGTNVYLGSGDYGGQSLSYNAALVGASSKVVFQPAPGASPSVSGELSLRASPGQPIANVEFDNFTVADVYVKYVQHVIFRNVNNTYWFIRSSDDVSFVGGSSGGDHYGNSDTIGASGAGEPGSTNILLDGVTFHDFNNDLSPGTHQECIFIQEAANVTIRNSTFVSCRDFDIYGNVLFGGSISNVTLDNNHFGVTAPVGYYAFRANVGSYSFHNNSWDQGMSNDPPVSATGCGNTVSSSSVAMPAALLQHC